MFKLAVAAVYIVGGVGSAPGRNWGRITAIVVNTIAVALTVVGLVGGGGDASGVIIPLIWSGVIVAVAWTGSPKADGLARAGMNQD